MMLKDNIFSILTALAILFLSLTGSQTFDSVTLPEIPFADKLVHFIMYFFLISVMTYENRARIRSERNIVILSVIPLGYGIFIEILQKAFTVNRTGDILDALSDAAGIYFFVLIWIIVRTLRKNSDRNLV